MASTEFATRSHKGAGFLFLMGFALLATGVGFAFAPHFSWQVHTFARKVNEFGLQNGALAMGGLVIFALGIVARVAGSSATVPDSSSANDDLRSELNLLNEQVSNKLGQLRTALLQINEGVTGIVAQQQIDAQSQNQSQGGPADQSQDAVFRLAASLDKLHAHLDERVHAVDLQLRSGFETLLNVSYELRRLLDQPGHVSAPNLVEHAHVAHAHGGHGAHAQPAAEGGIDFYETMQKLDAIAGESSPPPQPRGRQPQAPFPSQGQGQLDALLPEEYRDRY